MSKMIAGAPERQPTPRRFNIAEYAAMWAHGIFSRDERVELVTGEIVEMPSVTPPHMGTVAYLDRAFQRALPERAAIVWVAQAVALAPDSLPIPDLALLRYRADGYRRAHARAEDVLLLVEVAEAPLRYERGRKLALYARAGIRDCWVVDLAACAVEIFRQPAGDRYADARAVRNDALLAPEAFPDCRLRLKEIFGLG